MIPDQEVELLIGLTTGRVEEKKLSGYPVMTVLRVT